MKHRISSDMVETGGCNWLFSSAFSCCYGRDSAVLV